VEDTHNSSWRGEMGILFLAAWPGGGGGYPIIIIRRIMMMMMIIMPWPSPSHDKP
jgi:hypothetical protein